MRNNYYTLLERLLREGFPGHRRSDLSVEIAYDFIDHEDFDIPGVMACSHTGRMLLIVEGDKAFVGPIIEKALEVSEACVRPTPGGTLVRNTRSPQNG